MEAINSPRSLARHISPHYKIINLAAMLNRALLTSQSAEWTTPQDLYEALDQRFHFELDPCATPQNAKCRRFFSKVNDGLKQKWTGRVFMNPPYGREIGRWVKKAFEESRHNAELVICLVPARTDTRWWHDWCLRGEIQFIRGRLKFGAAKNPAPFPSALIGFWKYAESLNEIANGWRLTGDFAQYAS
jgi:phage N-6-adenine-methyltransferase